MGHLKALLVGGVVAPALALGGLVGGVLAEPRRDSTAAASVTPGALADLALALAAGGVGAPGIARLGEKVAAQPRDGVALTTLGFAYQVRRRETSDPSFLTRSETALRRALRVDPIQANAVLGLGHVALIRHDFRTALVHGRRAARMLPGSARPYGVIGDALEELGRYEQAFRALDTMVARRPSLASYSRVGYGRELVGDVTGARAAMRLALGAAAGQPEPSAWAHVALAKLEHGPGRVERAERHLRKALAIVPGYAPARMELARVELAKGRLARALREARLAADATPTPHTYDLLAELLDRAGRHSAASRQRAAGAPLDRQLRANGMRIDLEIAVHQSDFGVEPAATVAAARRGRAESTATTLSAGRWRGQDAARKRFRMRDVLSDSARATR